MKEIIRTQHIPQSTQLPFISGTKFEKRDINIIRKLRELGEEYDK